MSLSTSIRGFLFVGICAVSIGCDERKDAAPKPPVDPPGGKAKEVLPDDPLKRDKEVLAMKKPGRWQVKGEDKANFQWEGYLVVEQAPDAYLSRGFFEWVGRLDGKVVGGRYHFEGTYDRGARTVRWTGFTILDRFGNPCNALYEATLSRDGRRLNNGAWSGGISIPGTWSAEYSGEL